MLSIKSLSVLCVLCGEELFDRQGRKERKWKTLKSQQQIPSNLANRKFHFRLGVGGNSVAQSGTITPESHCIEDFAIVVRPGALQDQRAVYTAICPDNEADTDLRIGVRFFQQRIGCGQSLRRLCLSATGAAGGMHEGCEFRVMDGRIPEMMLPRTQGSLSCTPPWSRVDRRKRLERPSRPEPTI